MKSASIVSPPSSLRVEIFDYQSYMVLGKSKPRKLYVNWNLIWNGQINKFSRASLKKQLETYLGTHIDAQLGPYKGFLRENVGKTCRLSIEMEVHKKRRKPLWDTDNLGIWVKAFNDTLKSRGYIEDDNYLYIKKSGGVEEFELPLNSTFDKLLAFNLHFVDL